MRRQKELESDPDVESETSRQPNAAGTSEREREGE